MRQCALREMKFLVWLAEREAITPAQVVQVLARQSAAHKPIGRIAMEQRLLSLAQIRDILRYQADHGGLFGGIALSERMLTTDQLDRLLRVQDEQIPALDRVLVELELLSPARLEQLKLEAVYTPQPDVAPGLVRAKKIASMTG